MKKVLCCIFLIVGCLLIIPMMVENEVVAAIRSGTISAVDADGTHVHTYTRLISTLPATCKATGRKVMQCSCGAKQTITIPKLSTHRYGSAKYASMSITTHQKKQTCSVCGKVSASYLNHTFSSGRCTLCGQQKCLTGMVVSSHWSYVVSKGFEKYDEEEHYQKYYCNQCGVNIRIPKAHNMVSGRCKDCGYERCSETFVAPGHTPTFRRYEAINNEKHNAIYFCDRCNQEIKIEEKHGFLKIITATCLEAGEEISKCACGRYIFHGVKAALDHDFNNKICSRCGAEEEAEPATVMLNGNGPQYEGDKTSKAQQKVSDEEAAEYAKGQERIRINAFSQGVENVQAFNQSEINNVMELNIIEAATFYTDNNSQKFANLQADIEKIAKNSEGEIESVNIYLGIEKRSKNKYAYGTTFRMAAEMQKNSEIKELINVYVVADSEGKVGTSGTVTYNYNGTTYTVNCTFISNEGNGANPHDDALVSAMAHIKNK